MAFDFDKVVDGTRLLLEGLGEDPEREGLHDTPTRVARMWQDLLARKGGYHVQMFESEYDQMILVRDIPFASFCEHHLLPFVGVGHLAYIPSGGCILGLSKLARILDDVAAGLQIQERLTEQVAGAIEQAVSPQGVAVVLEAEHTCMTIRGVLKAGSRTVTSALRGVFLDKPESREEFFACLRYRNA